MINSHFIIYSFQPALFSIICNVGIKITNFQVHSPEFKISVPPKKAEGNKFGGQMEIGGIHRTPM
jgi:hypothetical protein